MTGKNIRDMTVGKPLWLIVEFALPLFFGNLFQQLYNMVDTIIVGQYLGVNALAAVGSVSSVSFLIIGFCVGACAGMAIPIAQSFGAKDEESIRRYAANSIWISAIMAIVLTIATSLLAKKIIVWMNNPEDIRADAYNYLIIILLGIPATVLYNLVASWMRALGDSKRPLYSLIISSVLNVGMDLLFIIKFQMGCAGAALATVLSQLISGLLCVVYIIVKMPALRIRRQEWYPSAYYLKTLCNMGFPMGFQNSITGIGSVCMASAVNTLGAVSVASVTTAFKLEMLFTGAFDALGCAMATFCGQNIGAYKPSRVRTGLRYSLLIGFCFAIIIYIIMFFFENKIALLFVKPEETVILSNIRHYVLINSAFFIELCIVLVVRYSIQGLGFSKVAMLAGVFEMVSRVVVAFALVPVMGYNGACFANPAAWSAASLFLIPCYLIIMKRLQSTIPNEVVD